MDNGRRPFQFVEANLRHAMEFYSRANESGLVKAFPGVETISCGRDYPVFNSALLNSPVPGGDGNLKSRLSIPSTFFKTIGMGWSYWMCHDLLDRNTLYDMSTTCSAFGLDPVLTAPGMIAESLHAPARKPPAMQIREVNDAPTRLVFAHLVSMIFDLPFQMTLNIYGNAAIWNEDYAGFVGYAADRPVAIAMLNNGGGCSGFYSVGTLPGFRRRGYAETLMRQGYDSVKSRWKTDICVLQSSTAGRRLYEKMGFREVTQFSVYRCAAGETRNVQ